MALDWDDPLDYSKLEPEEKARREAEHRRRLDEFFEDDLDDTEDEEESVKAPATAPVAR